MINLYTFKQYFWPNLVKGTEASYKNHSCEASNPEFNCKLFWREKPVACQIHCIPADKFTVFYRDKYTVFSVLFTYGLGADLHLPNSLSVLSESQLSARSVPVKG